MTCKSSPTELKHSTLPNGVSIVDPLEVEDWDELISQFDAASFFHSKAWAKVLQVTYGYRPRYFINVVEGHLQAILPVMEVNSWLTGKRGVSLPFTDECGPLAIDKYSLTPLHQAAVSYARKHSWKYLEYRGGRELIAGETVVFEKFANHLLPLDSNEEVMMARFDGSVRRAIRKAQRNEVQVECATSLEATKIFYQLFCRTRRRHGAPPQPFKFFENIQRHIFEQKLGWVLIARHRGVPIAGGVFFHFGKRALFKFGASDERMQHLRANNLLKWEVIRRYGAAGFRVLDMGRTAPSNLGLMRYKASWGTEVHEIQYFGHDFQKRRNFRSEGAAGKMLQNACRVLPGTVSRVLGILLYKHIAALAFSNHWMHFSELI